MKEQFLDDIGLEELIGYIKQYVKDDQDVKPYASYSVFPKTGEQNIIYIDTTNNLTYYWDDTSKTYKALDVQTWDNLSGKPSTFPPSTHNHDDLYYTETEINTKLAGKANSSHTHKKTDITDFPTSMPASDVKAWAKADTKPVYTKSEVGLGNVDNTADKDKSVKYATSAGAASSVDWSGVKNKPGTYPPSAHNHNIENLTNFNARVYDAAGTRAENTVLAAPSDSNGTARFRKLVAADLPSHTHNYAGSASAGGAADSSLSLFTNPSTRQTSGDYDMTSSTYACKVTHSIASTIMKTGRPPEDSSVLTFGWDTSAGWGAQLAIGSCKGNHLYVRGANSKQKTVDNKTVNYSEWDSDWRTILDSGNYSNYTVTKTGGGASGNWGINAASASKLTTNAGSSTQPIYFSNGVPVSCAYTLGKSVPSNAVFTDTNTWRGCQNNLTSTATDQSLSAAQGKWLNENKLNAINANGYWGMATPSGNSGDWIRTTSAGIIPYQPGGINSSHCGLGTSSWYFNYAYITTVYGNLSGNASTASKLATARNIALGGLSSGSANFDGSGNVTINDWGYGVTKYVTRDSASAPYYRVAYCEVKGSYIDKSVIFTIDSGCNDGGFGIVKVCLRSNNTTTAGQTYCEVSWLIRQGFSADQLLVKVNSPAGTSTVQYADLYFKATGTYNGITVKSLSSTSQRDTVERAWTFTNPGSESCRAQPNIRTYTATYTGCDAGTASYTNKLRTARAIFGKSFDGTADVAGQGLFYGTKSNADGRYANSALQIRENNLVGNTQSDFVYAPSIGFHWSNRVAGFMALHTDGNFYFRKQNGNDRATIDANLNGNASTASYASSAGSVAWGNVSGRPSSMPASDVYAWAKASSKPSYSWGEITGKPSSFTPSSHTHNYLPLSGGTMTGNINYTARGNSYIGSGEQDNAEGSGGKLNNLVISSWWGVSFTTSCAGQTYSNKTAIGIDCRNGILKAARVDASSFNGYTINASVPSGAKFTDTNTWRGIQNNLSSDSTTESLSAAQGKRLKGLVDGKAPMNAIHNLNYGIAIPTSDMNSNGAQNTIYPAKYENGAYSKTTGVSTYANRNNTVSIGTSANMFGDIYLAGGVTSLGVYSLTTTTNLPVSITSQGYLRRYKSGSSLMIKNHIYKIGYDEAKELLNTNVYSFRYNDDGQPANGKEHAAIDRYGFVLEDMEKTFPMAVEYDEDGLPAAWCVQIIVPTILEIVKHQQTEISTLKAENEKLKEKISEIDNIKKNLDELRVLIVNK